MFCQFLQDNPYTQTSSVHAKVFDPRLVEFWRDGRAETLGSRGGGGGSGDGGRRAVGGRCVARAPALSTCRVEGEAHE